MMSTASAYFISRIRRSRVSQGKETAMSSITYRDGGKSLSSYRTHSSFGSYAEKLVRAWRRWQTERQIESMPLDIRKDIGWPSADETGKNRAH